MRNCPLHNAIEEQISAMKGVGRRRRMQALDDIRSNKILGAKEKS
jgi:hypothetical protein